MQAIQRNNGFLDSHYYNSGEQLDDDAANAYFNMSKAAKLSKSNKGLLSANSNLNNNGSTSLTPPSSTSSSSSCSSTSSIQTSSYFAPINSSYQSKLEKSSTFNPMLKPDLAEVHTTFDRSPKMPASTWP